MNLLLFPKLTTILFIAAVGTASGVIVVYLFWWLKSRYKILTAKERPLRARKVSLWHDPIHQSSGELDKFVAPYRASIRAALEASHRETDNPELKELLEKL